MQQNIGGGPIEVVRLRLQSLRVEAHRQQDLHFRTKLQLEEQLEENEVKLHFTRGVIEGLDKAEAFIAEALTPVEVPSEIRMNQAMAGDIVGEQRFPKVEGSGVEDILSQLPEDL